MGVLDVAPEDITEGPIAPTLVVLALPLVVQNLVHVVNQVVDTFWLGRLGEAEVAAVGLNFPLIASLIGVTMTASVGTQILVAQRVGADEPALARRVVVNGVGLALVLGLLLVGVVVAAGPTLVRTLAGDPEVGPLAAAYLLVIIGFFPLISVSETLERGFIGWGDTAAALFINLTTVAVNIVLDPLFILGLGPVPALGVRGAALATGVGYTAGMVVAVALAAGLRSSLSLSPGDLEAAWPDVRELARVGVPISGKRLAGQSARLVIVGAVAVVGGAAGLAAYTVGARIASVAVIPATGFGSATQSMVGQNLGADRLDRAHHTIRTGVVIAGGTLLAVGAGQWLAPGALGTLFVPTFDGPGLALTVDYLEILAYGYWAIGVSAVILAAFNGASRTRISFVVDLIKYWGIRIPIAVAALPATGVALAGVTVAGLDLGIHAIFWAVTGSNVVVAVAIAVVYLWRHERMYVAAAERVSGTASD